MRAISTWYRAPQRTVRLSDPQARLFASGHAVDIVLAVLLGEALWLVGRRGWAVVEAATLLLPGALLLAALRAALTGQDWRWIAVPLALSFPVHLADVARRSARRCDRPPAAR